jgi:hypothetical protein
MYIGRPNNHLQNVAHNISYNVSFAAFDFFPPSIPRSSEAETVFTLCESIKE